MRTIIELTDEQVAALAELCKREQISRAEAVRRAVDGLIHQTEDRRERRLAALRATAGMWKGRGIDGLDYQRQIRAEWDREWDPD